MEDGKWVKRYESNEEPKANAITTCRTDSMVGYPIRVGIIENNLKIRTMTVNSIGFTLQMAKLPRCVVKAVE